MGIMQLGTKDVKDLEAAEVVAKELRSTICRMAGAYGRIIATEGAYQGDIIEACGIHFDDMIHATHGREAKIKAETINMARYTIAAAALMDDIYTQKLEFKKPSDATISKGVFRQQFGRATRTGKGAPRVIGFIKGEA